MCRGTCGRHTPPAPLVVILGRSNKDAVPQREDRDSPKMRTKDVRNHKAEAGVVVDIVTIGR